MSYGTEDASPVELMRRRSGWYSTSTPWLLFSYVIQWHHESWFTTPWDISLEEEADEDISFS